MSDTYAGMSSWPSHSRHRNRRTYTQGMFQIRMYVPVLRLTANAVLDHIDQHLELNKEKNAAISLEV